LNDVVAQQSAHQNDMWANDKMEKENKKKSKEKSRASNRASVDNGQILLLQKGQES
jgi:hypothetical protein